jgi:hypothetical protein
MPRFGAATSSRQCSAAVETEDTRAVRPRVFSDAIVADFRCGEIRTGRSSRCARPYPYDGGRADLLSVSYGDGRGRPPRRVGDVRTHGLAASDIETSGSHGGVTAIVARPGQLADGSLQRASQSQRGLYFAHTDVQGAPAFENAMAAASDAVDAIRHRT